VPALLSVFRVFLDQSHLFHYDISTLKRLPQLIVAAAAAAAAATTTTTTAGSVNE
jgi:hypothetical protein